MDERQTERLAVLKIVTIFSFHFHWIGFAANTISLQASIPPKTGNTDFTIRIDAKLLGEGGGGGQHNCPCCRNCHNLQNFVMNEKTV
jgi:hypothetical protein